MGLIIIWTGSMSGLGIFRLGRIGRVGGCGSREMGKGEE